MIINAHGTELATWMFDLYRVVMLVMVTAGITVPALLLTRPGPRRVLLAGITLGFVFYNGIGATLTGVPVVFSFYYVGVLLAIVISFNVGCLLFSWIPHYLRSAAPLLIALSSSRALMNGIIMLFILASIFPLLWPELRLHQLLSPPSPDLRAALDRRLTGGADPISSIMEYAHLFLAPFFFIGLYFHRKRKWLILSLLTFLLYTHYVNQASIGRGTVVIYLGLFILAIWHLEPKRRVLIALSVVVASPLVFYAFYWYSRIRIGGVVGDVGILEAMMSVLLQEISFPLSVGTPIIDSGERVDLGSYLLWIATLPIPKLLVGSIDGARVNYEISEIVLGVSRTHPNWYVVLPGLVAESVYIYGGRLFWLHGIFIGVIAAFFARIAERIPQMLFLYMLIVVQSSYVLNRGGVSAWLPFVLNEMLPLYLFLFFAALHAGTNSLFSTKRYVLPRQAEPEKARF